MFSCDQIFKFQPTETFHKFGCVAEELAKERREERGKATLASEKRLETVCMQACKTNKPSLNLEEFPINWFIWDFEMWPVQ